jgi:hypothetical protein
MNAKPTPKEIQSNLNQFSGSETFVRFGASILTEGVVYLCEAAESFWLIDIINSIRHKEEVRYSVLKDNYFQTFDLTVKNGKGKVIVTDGNKNVLYTQNIPFTDFPLDKIILWRVDGTVMLPSEY